MTAAWPDLVNGGYELLASLLVANHCRVAYKDKAVAGVSILSVALFATWGLWKLFYYPHLGQWFSLAAGMILMSANIAWVCLLLRYRSARSKAVGNAEDGCLLDRA
jgi:hypothetical protein